MKPPSSCQIGPYTYRIVVDEAAIHKAESEAKEPRFGEHDARTLSIVLDPKMAPDMMASVLLHEIEHACLYQVGADEDLEKDQVERVCNATGSLLLDVLRRNPGLVEYLCASSRTTKTTRRTD